MTQDNKESKLTNVEIKALCKIIQKQLDEIETLREINDYLATSLAMANEIIEIIKDKVKTMESTKEKF